jgi:hypothetical protein
MNNILREKVTDRFEQPVDNPRDCDLLSSEIFKRTGRNISSTTLRRFFGMLSSNTELSRYSLDTLAKFCGSANYENFCHEFGLLSDLITYDFKEVISEIEILSKFTLNSITRKSLTPFSATIPRKNVNHNLESFLASEFTVFPLIAPGGYGKSLAVAHWIKAHQTSKTAQNLFLFCHASMFNQLLIQSKHSSRKLNVNLDDSRNLFQQFSMNQSGELQKLVLVIDGLDEPEINTKSIIQLASFVRNAATLFMDKSFLKIVLVIREVTWNKFLLPEIASNHPGWLLYSNVDSLESGHSNLPVLSNSEVKEIIALHNRNHKKPIIYDCIDWRLRELIRIPLNLFILSSLTSRSVTMSEMTPDLLLLEYINTLVFKVRFAEEKAEIIWKLIEFSLENPAGYSVKKSQLKDIYPIHFRKEFNFFLAYQDLVSKGILDEVQVQNKYGLYVTEIRFRHTNFYYFLTALYFVDHNNRIDTKLFKSILDHHQGIEWTTNVLSYVYQLAYTNEEYDVLKEFCKLDETILSSQPIRHAVGAAFRQSNNIRIPLINEFAKNPLGQVHFFERFVDTNYIFNNFEYRIREYLKNKKTNEAILFGHNILFLAEFLKMNRYGCGKQMAIIDQIEPDHQIHPWPIGRKVSTTIMYRYIINKDPIPDLESYIEHYRSIACGYENYLTNGVIEFEMSIMVALILIEEFEVLIKMIDHASETYNLADPAHEGFSWMHQHQNHLCGIFRDFASFKCSGTTDAKLISKCEKSLNNYVSIFDDFQYLILINYFLFEYNMFSGKEGVAAGNLQNALDLSRYAKYTFYETYLLNKGSVVIPEYGSKSIKLIKSSHFNAESPSFNPCIILQHSIEASDPEY